MAVLNNVVRVTFVVALLGALVFQAEAAVIIRSGVRPIAHSAIVCRDNVVVTRIGNTWAPVAWYNNAFWPLSGLGNVNLLARDARSCSRITVVRPPAAVVRPTVVVAPRPVVVAPRPVVVRPTVVVGH